VERALVVGCVPDPLGWEHWEEAKAFLEPARIRGDFETVWEPDELLWAVMDGDELLAVATAWLGTDRTVEVKLVGGRDCRRWIKQLDDRIGAAALEAGATKLLAIGRVGWTKILRRNGWERVRSVEDHWLFERQLTSGKV